MKKHLIIYLLALLMPVGLLSSCSENDSDVEEYPNWKATNDKFFNNLYTTAKADTAQGNQDWKIIRQWSLVESGATAPSDYIVVNVLEHGTGSGCPSTPTR